MSNNLEFASVQQLSPTRFKEQVRQLTPEEAQNLLIQFHQQVRHQEHQTKALLSNIADLMEALA